MTCHTVENMVIKLAKVCVERGGTMHSESVVMPGAVLEYGAVLKGNSQVLKGESVECCTVWAGLPAALVSRHGQEKESNHAEDYDEFVTHQGGPNPKSNSTTPT